jgi:hypothetical protein
MSVPVRCRNVAELHTISYTSCILRRCESMLRGFPYSSSTMEFNARDSHFEKPLAGSDATPFFFLIIKFHWGKLFWAAGTLLFKKSSPFMEHESTSPWTLHWSKCIPSMPSHDVSLEVILLLYCDVLAGNATVISAFWIQYLDLLNLRQAELQLIVRLTIPIIRVIMSRRMRWMGHVARMGRKRNAYRILVGKPAGKRSLCRTRHR